MSVSLLETERGFDPLGGVWAKFKRRPRILIESFHEGNPVRAEVIQAGLLGDRERWGEVNSQGAVIEGILSGNDELQEKVGSIWGIIKPSVEAQAVVLSTLFQGVAARSSSAGETWIFHELAEKVSDRILSSKKNRQIPTDYFFPLIEPTFTLSAVGLPRSPFPKMFSRLIDQQDQDPEVQSCVLFLLSLSPILPALFDQPSMSLLAMGRVKRIFETVSKQLKNPTPRLDRLTEGDLRFYAACTSLSIFGSEVTGRAGKRELSLSDLAIQKLSELKERARDQGKELGYLVLWNRALSRALPTTKGDITAYFTGNAPDQGSGDFAPRLADFLQTAIHKAQDGDQAAEKFLDELARNVTSDDNFSGITFLGDMYNSKVFSSSEIIFLTRIIFKRMGMVLTLDDNELLPFVEDRVQLNITPENIYLIDEKGNMVVAGYVLPKGSKDPAPQTATPVKSDPAAEISMVIFEETAEATGNPTEETAAKAQEIVEIQEESILDRVRRVLGPSLLEDYEDEYEAMGRVDDEWNKVEHDRTNRFATFGSSCTLDKDSLKKAGPNTYPRLDFFHGKPGAVINGEVCSDIRGTLWLDKDTPLPFALSKSGWLIDRGESDFFKNLPVSEETMPLFLALSGRICMQARKLLIQSTEIMKERSMEVFLREAFNEEEEEQKDPDGKYRRKTITVKVENGVTVIEHGLVKSFILDTDNTTDDYENRKITAEKASKMLEEDPDLEVVSESRFISPKEYLKLKKMAKRRGKLQKLSDIPNRGGLRWPGLNKLPSLEILEYLEKHEPNIRLRIRTIFYRVDNEKREATMYSTYVRPRGQRVEEEIYSKGDVRELELAAV